MLKETKDFLEYKKTLNVNENNLYLRLGQNKNFYSSKGIINKEINDRVGENIHHKAKESFLICRELLQINNFKNQQCNF